MTTEYEISGNSRDGLIYTKDQLIVDEPIVRHWDTKKELPPDRDLLPESIGSVRVGLEDNEQIAPAGVIRYSDGATPVVKGPKDK
jgi:hypothetical protein